MTRLWWVGGAFSLVAACTKPNPAATCADGTCSDPAFPFCDVDGEISGTPGSCIAVTCDAGSIGGCQGSDELICSATGATYVAKSCADGCDPIAGCLECAPDQSVCTTDGNFQSCDANGSATTRVCSGICDATAGCLDCAPSSVTCTAGGSAVQTCDGSGSIASTTVCALDCGSVGGAHCTQLVPSNGLQTYFDMSPDPVDVTFANGTLSLGSDATKFFPSAGGAAITVVAFQVTAPSGGAPITVIVGRKITLDNISIENADPTVTGGLGAAVAFLATGDLAVTGTVLVETGAVSIAGCNGGLGAIDSSAGEPHQAGAGGGGNATAGASGGNVEPAVLGGAQGAATGSDDLIPLKGGCPGGTSGALFAGHGGGAAQLVSLTSIEVSARLVADGNASTGGAFGGGGGAGGAILLEAPTVTLDAASAVLARGGGGFSGDGSAGAPPDDVSPFPGGICGSGSVNCSNGGRGATVASPATAGSNLTVPRATDEARAGGGGGGVGRIRINTRDGTFTQANTAIVAGRLTTGTAATR